MDEVTETGEPELEYEVEAPAYRGQAAHDQARRERKARAAVTMEADAKAAQTAKRKAQAKAFTVPGAKAFADKAKAVEKKIADKRAASLKVAE